MDIRFSKSEILLQDQLHLRKNQNFSTTPSSILSGRRSWRALEIHSDLSPNMGHHDNAVRTVVGILHSPHRVANLHAGNFALRREKGRLPVGSAIFDLVGPGPGHIGLRRCALGSKHLLPSDFHRLLELGGFYWRQFEFRRCYLGRMRSSDRHDDARWSGFSLWGHLCWQPNESHTACTTLRRHSLWIDERCGQHLRISSAFCDWQYGRRTCEFFFLLQDDVSRKTLFVFWNNSVSLNWLTVFYGYTVFTYSLRNN